MDTAARVRIDEGVVFGTAGERELRCDVFTPPGDVVDAPAVLLVHGGGWRQGDRTQLHGYGIMLGRSGYVCVACEYRLVPSATWPEQLHDVKAAIRWMRANAESLHIDPDRIVVEGNSAGAHLALMVAGTPNVPEFEGDGGNRGVSTHVSAVIAVYPPTHFSVGEYTRGATPLVAMCDDGGTEEIALAASPLTYALEGFPPTMLVHGTKDEVVHPLATVRMYEALTKAHVPVEVHLYAEQPHAFDANPKFGRQCAAEMLLFLDRYNPTSLHQT
jgi:acetyl esterase/lipase